MADYKQLRRLETIINIIKNKPGITKSSLIDVLNDSHDINVSDRTLDRDFNFLNTDFGLNITYNRAIKGYCLEEDEDQLQAFFKFAELSALADLYKTGLKDYKTFKKWVIPDDSSGFRGLNVMKTISIGITHKRKLSFDKINYDHDTTKSYYVTPLRLKEYLNRWYLVAIPDGLTEIRTFGLDRIINLKVLNTKAKPIKNINKQLKQFLDVVGLNYSEYETLQKVVLRVETTQIKYLRSMPLHHSQICLDAKNNEDWGTIKYLLKPNYEFESQLLKLGETIEVLEPKSLRSKIIERVSLMNEIYK